MKKLLENWRHFVLREGYFSSNFKKFYKLSEKEWEELDLDSDHYFNERSPQFKKYCEWLNKIANQMFEKFGAGASRYAYATEYKEEVIKISKSHVGAKSNEKYYELASNPQTAQFLPKAFEHGPLFSWILIEYVKPFQTDKESFDHFPNLTEAAKVLNPTPTDYGELATLALEFVVIKLFHPSKEKPFFAHKHRLFDPNSDYAFKRNPHYSLEEIKKFCYISLEQANEEFIELAKFLARFGGYHSDWWGGNSGINKDGEFKILDPDFTVGNMDDVFDQF